MIGALDAATAEHRSALFDGFIPRNGPRSVSRIELWAAIFTRATTLARSQLFAAAGLGDQAVEHCAGGRPILEFGRGVSAAKAGVCEAGQCGHWTVSHPPA